MNTQTGISPKLMLITLLFTATAFLSEVRGHGVQIDTFMHPPYVSIRAFFTRTSPILDAQVSVTSPGDSGTWQTGRTDKSGNFAFMPDQAGTWVVVVDDGRGHRGRATIDIAEGFFDGSGPYAAGTAGNAVTEHFVIEDEQPESGHKPTMEKEVIVETTVTKNIPIIYRAIFGLSLIFGITGIAYGMKMHSRGRVSDKG